ncbi:MAG: hypothetical protein K2Q22_17880 [Cytophagales bacterium]|nr:hypothetical protein [Cytophagales bacterium]
MTHWLFIVSITLFSCSKKETPVPEKNYFKGYLGTYTGYQFPGERMEITKVSNILSKSVYVKGGQKYEFNLQYDSDVESSSSGFPLQVVYCRINPSTQILGGNKDYDSLTAGIQNAKFSYTQVFGELKSLQFSVVIDSVELKRSFIQ